MSSPSVLFVLPDIATPSLGVRNTWRTAELLASEGVDAAVWHYAAGFTPSWFESSAPVVHGAELELTDDHVVIVPEVLVLSGHDPAPGGRLVIFNQDPLSTYDNVAPTEPYPGWRSQPMVWSSTQAGTRLLTRLLPDLEVSFAPAWIDIDRYRPRSLQASRRIAYSSSGRTRAEALTVSLLRGSAALEGWQLVGVDRLTETDRADVLGSSDVFLALGADDLQEHAVSEALASGCYVVAFEGAAAVSSGLLDPRWSMTVAAGDVEAVVDATSTAVHAVEHGDLRADAATARDEVAHRYRRSAVAARLTELVNCARKMPTASDVRAEHPLAFFERHQLPTSFDRQTTINELREQNRRLLEITATIPVLRKEYGEALAAMSSLREEIAMMRADIADADRISTASLEVTSRLRSLEGGVATRDDALSRRIKDLEESTSWRATAPLRWLSGLAMKR